MRKMLFETRSRETSQFAPSRSNQYLENGVHHTCTLCFDKQQQRDRGKCVCARRAWAAKLFTWNAQFQRLSFFIFVLLSKEKLPAKMAVTASETGLIIIIMMTFMAMLLYGPAPARKMITFYAFSEWEKRLSAGARARAVCNEIQCDEDE